MTWQASVAANLPSYPNAPFGYTGGLGSIPRLVTRAPYQSPIRAMQMVATGPGQPNGEGLMTHQCSHKRRPGNSGIFSSRRNVGPLVSKRLR